jgi:hypothetical protein
MKETKFTKAVTEVVNLEMKAMDKIIEEMIEPLTALGSPEKLLGKKYEEWTPQELQQITAIYGTKEPSPLSNLIYEKTLAKVKLEEEDTGGR